MRLSPKTLVAVVLVLSLAACDGGAGAQQQLARGRTLLDEGQFDQAVIALKAAVKADAGLLEARSLLGKAYFEQGDFDSAEKELSRVLDAGAEADHALIVPLLALTWLHMGEYERLDRLQVGELEPASRATVLAAKGLAVLYRGDTVAAADIIATANRVTPAPPFARVARARLALAEGDLDTAAARLDEIVESDENYAPAWNLRGDIEAARRRPEAAEAAYSRVLELSPTTFDARLNRVMMRIYQKNLKGAREDLQALKQLHPRAVRVHPGVSFAEGIILMQAPGMAEQARKAFEQTADYSYSYPLSYYYMAVIDLQGGSRERALGEVYRFIALAPESVAGPKLAARLELELGGFAAAEALLEPLVAAHPDDAEALNLLASAKLGVGKGGEGVELLARAVELQPKSVLARARLGAGYLSQGDVDAALVELEETLEANPEFEQADILIVLNHLQRGEAQLAVAAARKYRDRNPGSTTSYNLLGRAWLAAGDEARAEAAYNKALELDITDQGAWHGLADIALRQGQYMKARKYYWQVLEHSPDDLPTQMKVVAAYAQEGDEEYMYKALGDAMDAHPDAIEPVVVLARYYIASGRLDEAAPLFDRLLQQHGEHPDVLAAMAAFQLAANRHNQALQTLERLLRVRPDVAQYQYMTSRVYAELGDTQNMLRALQRTVELDPGHFYARLAQARLALAAGDLDALDARLAELEVAAPRNPDVMLLEVGAARARGRHDAALKLLQQMYAQGQTTASVVALARQHLAMDQAAKGVALLDEWLAAHPADTRAREALAEIHVASGSITEAIAQYRRVVQAESENVVALNNLAWYLLSEDKAEALRLAEQASLMLPDSASVLDTLAVAQLANNRVAEARRTIDRALALAPDNPDLLVHEAQVLVAEGAPALAVKQLSAVLAQHGEFPERKRAEAVLAELQ